MALNAVLNGRISTQSIKVNSNGGRITSAGGAGVTLSNQANEIRSIEDISDIVTTDLTDGATIVYNASLDKYEVKPINFLGQLDGGSF